MRLFRIGLDAPWGSDKTAEVMKTIISFLVASVALAALTSCEILINEDGSKSVILDAAAIAKIASAKAGLDGENFRYENGKIIATK
jgi:hypothetical protein